MNNIIKKNLVDIILTFIPLIIVYVVIGVYLVSDGYAIIGIVIVILCVIVLLFPSILERI